MNKTAKTKYINQNDPTLNFEIVKIEFGMNSEFRFFSHKHSKRAIGIGNMCRKTNPCVHDVCFKIKNKKNDIELQVQEERYDLKKIAKMLGIDYKDLKTVHKLSPETLVKDGDYMITKTF
jgi:hypothetical protein